jgi:AcrR family transcriptional regulator
MATIKRRAISESQKQERQQAILTTALELFEEKSYQEITLEMVAARLGIARATLYLYFKTREELFLAVLEQLHRQFQVALGVELETLLANSRENRPTIPQIADLISKTLVKHWSATRLAVLLPTVLEQNVDFETALAFKRGMLACTLPTLELLEEALPFLKGGRGTQFMLRIQTIITGLQPYTNPAPVIQQVTEQPDMAIFRLDFREECTQLLRALLYGMEYESRLTSQS